MNRNINVGFICLTLSLVSACAASDARTAASDPSECVREYRTGSNIPVTNCSVPQTEAERQRTLDETKTEIRTAPRLPRKGEGG